MHYLSFYCAGGATPPLRRLTETCFCEETDISRKGERTVDEKEKQTPSQSFCLYLHDLVYMLCAVMVIFMLLFRIVVVSGPSMNSTLIDGDLLLLLSNSLYRTPAYGDVVVAAKDTFDNGKPIVKRVIATEGQTVDIDFEQGVVFVDGVMLTENYVNTPTNLYEGQEFPQTVEPGCVFLMGDNRNNSKDSRSLEIGQVDRRELLGKVLLLTFPGTDGGRFAQDFSRIGLVK